LPSTLTTPRTVAELRKATRYPLIAPATFCWERADGVLRETQGTTLNISILGVFVVATLFPPAGVHLEIAVCLPAASGAPRSVRLHGEGKVVRAGGIGPESGFAAEVIFRTECSAGSFFGAGGIIQ